MLKKHHITYYNAGAEENKKDGYRQRNVRQFLQSA